MKILLSSIFCFLLFAGLAFADVDHKRLSEIPSDAKVCIGSGALVAHEPEFFVSCDGGPSIHLFDCSTVHGLMSCQSVGIKYLLDLGFKFSGVSSARDFIFIR